MTVIKRDGSKEDFNIEKIASAVDKAFKSVNQITPVAIHEAVVNLFKNRDIIGVEEIQDEIEKLLIQHNCASAVRAYILYREKHKEAREINDRLDYMERYSK